MSGTSSMSLVSRQPGPPPSLAATHRDTFSVPNRSFMQAPSSTGHSLPPPIVTAASTPASRLSLKETSQVTAKNVLFYKSGDSNFESYKVAVTKRNFRTFDALLENLSEKVSLPFGVRTISTPNGTHGISRLDELEDGKAYICSDKKTVKPLDLSHAPKSKPPWFISKPKTRTRRVPTLARRSAQASEGSSSIPSRVAQVKTPKKVVIVKNGDPAFRHSILLSRRTHQNFDQILEDVAEIFRVKQQKLYTCEGKRVESLQELFSGGTVFVLGGKESFVAMEYRMKRPTMDLLKSGSSSDNTDSTRMPKELKRTKGRWRVTITTSELPAAGTDSRVILVVYGSKGNSGPISLSANNVSGKSVRDKTRKLFMSGNEDEFTVNVGFIGEIRKIRISHDNSGKTSPGWLCEDVVMSDLTTGETVTFPFNRWLSRDEDDGEVCRELPALHHDDTHLPVLRYIVCVHTGDLWNSGTEAHVFITLYGSAGDTGARLLQHNGRSKPLTKGSIEIFRLEAVDLGTLQRLVIGHDGTGPGAGWFLDKIIVREDRVGGEDHVFYCGRWLDESQDDGKIVRELYADAKGSNSRMRQHSEKSKELELWEQEKWKFQSGNHIMLISKASGKAIRTKPDGSVDGLGSVSHPFGVYKVIRRRNAVRTFASAHAPSFHLAIDQNRLLGQGKGGSFCEFNIKVLPDRSIILESCRYPGHFMSIDANGKSSDTRGHPTAQGRQFNVYVKGCFRNNSVILFNTSATQALVVTGVGDVVGTGRRGDITNATKLAGKSPGFTETPQWAHFRVIKVAEGVRMFQCEKNPRRYLRIKDGQCDGLGAGDAYCHFKVQKYKQGAFVTLQSMKHRGVFIGLSSNGRAKPTVDTGDSNTRFFPEVVKFGEKKQNKAPEYRTPEASFILPEVRDASRKHSSKTVTTSIQTTIPKNMAIIKSREFGSPGPAEGDFRVYVTTGNSGTKEVVTITAYGDKGRSANITLGKGHEKGVFQCGQTDEFEANFAEIGRLYKIRIGVEEASSNCDWRLKQVKMKDMTTNEIFRFKFNRWISRNKDDGDTLRELPAIIEGSDGDLEMLRYHIQVKTSKNSSSFSSKKPPSIFLCLFGEKGDAGRRLLQKRSYLRTDSKKDASRKPFMPNQNDTFEIEAVSLGALTKCSLSCPTSLRNSSKFTSTSTFPSWLCEEIVVRESEGATTEYVFTCNKWLGLKKAGSHATINLSVSEVRDISKSSNEVVDFKDGDWKLCVKTGSMHDAGTSANVTFYACGEDGTNSGNVILQGGAEGRFEPGKTVKFKVSLSEVKNIHKIRISHDNDGPDPSWYIESLKLVDPNSDMIYKLPVKKWLAVEKESFQLHTEVPIPKPGMETPAVLTYQVMVFTGSILGSDTDANVYICIYGNDDDTGLRPLIKSKTNATKFQESQMDVFDVDAVALGDLKKIKIGHDGHGPGSGWFLHKVVIKESPSSTKDWIFFCNKWLDHGQDDGKIEREIFVNDEEVSTEAQHYNEGKYQVLISTGVQSTTQSCLPDARVTMVVYGEEGKTGEIPIQSILSGRESGMRRKSRSKSQSGLRSIMPNANYFRPGQTDECKVVIPEIGGIYKIRVGYNHMSAWKSWFLDRVVLQDISSRRQLVFPCNRWLSAVDDDQETVRELALSTEGQETLKTILYNVTIYTGDRHGAGTDANITILLKGDRGDTGHRFLKRSPYETTVFQRGSADVFVIEAVDLGRLVEVIISHDGEGYGAGWFVEKVTVRSGEFASQEWVFPCNLWLDDSIGDRKISRRLFTIGLMNLETNEEELEILGNFSSREGVRDDVWDVTIFVSDVQTENLRRVHLMGTFYGSNGLKKSGVISMGEWSAGGRKRLKMQADLKEIGKLHKLRVEIPDYDESASLTLEYISMHNGRSKEQLRFAFHTQLYTDGGRTLRELPVLSPDKPLPKVVRYLVEVSTSKRSQTGILRLNLNGNFGDSGYRTLFYGSEAFHCTAHKDCHIFRLDAVDLGRLSSVALYLEDDSDKGSAWIIQSICVSIDDHPSSSAVPLSTTVIYKAEPDETLALVDDRKVLEKVYDFTEVPPDESTSRIRNTTSYQRDTSFRSIKKRSQGEWNLFLYYMQEKSSREKGDDFVMLQDLEKQNVSVQVFGTYGSSESLLLSSLNPRQSETPGVKTVETFLTLGQSMGILYLLRFTTGKWDSNLIKIKLKDVHTKQEFIYTVTDAQHRKMEMSTTSGAGIQHFDVPLIRPDIPPMDHHTYKFIFHTGDQPGAGTDANIWVNLSGTHGETGTRKVTQRNWNSFQRGKDEVFLLETVDVGMPRKISISHDGKGLGAGWLLEEITVQEERNEKMADHVFQCYKWLDDGVDERVTQKELYLTGTKFHYPQNFLKPSKGCWNCVLKAKESPDDDQDEPLAGKVAFYLKHRDGKNVTVTRPCKFESQEANFVVNFPDDEMEGSSNNNQDLTDDGFFKIRAECNIISGKNERKDWPFSELLMTDADSREKLHFVFDDAVWDGSSRNIIRELPVMRLRTKTLRLCDYYIMLFTANDSTAHSNQNMEIEIMLTGENGDTGWRQLRKKAGSAATAILQPGKMDMLFVEAVDLGEKVRSVHLKVGEKNVKWKLDRIKVKKEFFSKDEFLFEYGRWIEPSSAPNSEIKIGLSNTMLSHSPKPPQITSKPGVSESYDIHTLWDIQSSGDGVRSVKKYLPTLAVTLYGSDAQSDLELLNSKLSKTVGHCSSDIKVEPRKPLNHLKKIGVGIENYKDNRQLVVTHIRKIILLKITVKNAATDEYFSFAPEAVVFDNAATETRDNGKDVGTNWIELVPVRPKDEVDNIVETTDYAITVKTGDQDDAGTIANVYIILHGIKDGIETDSGKRWLNDSGDANKFTAGAESKFTLKSVNLGKIKQVTIGHDGNDAKMGWWLEKVMVKPSNEGRNYIFSCKKWLANLENNTFIERLLDISEIQNPETVPKRPISVQNSLAEEDKQDARVGTSETLHGSANFDGTE